MSARVIWIKSRDFIWKPKKGVHTDYDESDFDNLLKTTWKQAEKKEALNYKIEAVCSKILPGVYQIVVQLNPMRLRKRRMPEAISSLKQPFDPTKFNFTRVKKEEILFEFILTESFASSRNEGKKEEEGKRLSATMVVNTAPIIPFHSLFLPSRSRCRPQVLDYEGLLLGVAAVLASSTPALKVGFNSLGGMASVNHYHLHVYYAPFPICAETAKCERRVGPLYTFKEHYAPGFVFQLEGEDVHRLVRDAMTLVDFLLSEEVCHNVVVTRGARTRDEACEGGSAAAAAAVEADYDSVRVCIWARKSTYGVKQVDGFAVALCELAGHVPVYDEETWASISEDDVAGAMRDACHETYAALLPKINKLYS